jgi:hypothetical protein
MRERERERKKNEKERMKGKEKRKGKRSICFFPVFSLTRLDLLGLDVSLRRPRR